MFDFFLCTLPATSDDIQEFDNSVSHAIGPAPANTRKENFGKSVSAEARKKPSIGGFLQQDD
jgi:hypothetical protein